MDRTIQTVHEEKAQIGCNTTNEREATTALTWTGVEKIVQENFIWGLGPKALYPITPAEYKTDPDSINIKDLIRLFNDYHLPEKEYIPQQRRFLLL